MLARGLLVLGVAALAAGAWLSRARFERPSERSGLTVVLVDASASVRRTRPAQDEFVVRAALEAAASARDAGRDFALVRVGRDVRTLLAPGPGAEAFERLAAGEVGFEVAGDEALASALVEALTSVAGLFEGRGERELVLATDGAATDGDAVLGLAALARAGVVVRHVAPAPSERFDAELVRLRCSERVEPGAPLAVLAEIATVGDATGRAGELVVVARSTRGETTRRVPFAFAAAARNALALQVELGTASSGAIRIEATLAFAAPDAITENDRREAWIECGEPLRVLALGDAPWFDDLRALDGVNLERVEPEGCAERLARADLVLACDVDLRRLPSALVDFVRFGGAFAYVPGEASLAGWRSKTAIGATLPLELVREDARARTLVVLIDASGSMAGEPDRAARAAALELARAAGDDERVEVRFFTDRLGPAFPLGARDADARRREVQALLDARAPSGPTAIVRALEALAETRARATDRALVFLVSDGRDEAGASESDARRAHALLAATGAQLVVCALGASGSTPILDALLFPGERAVHPERPEELARVFARESARRDVVEDGPIVALVRSAGDLGAESFEAVFAAGLPHELAPLERKLRVRAGPLAKAVVVDGAGEPLVALARVGLGVTFATALAPDPRWTSEPGAWRALLASSVRALARRAHALTSGGPRARLGADGLELENVPPEWPVELVARVGPADALGGPTAAPEDVSTVTLRPADGRDGADPRTVRRAPASEFAGLPAGPLAVRVLVRGERVFSCTVIHAPRSEFGPPPEVWPPALPTAGRALEGGERHRGPHPHAGAWLAAGCAALFLGAALRLTGRS